MFLKKTAGERTGKRTLGMSKDRWKDNIRVNLKEIG